MRRHFDKTSVIRIFVTLVLVAVVAGGATAGANHFYNDVPDGSFFGPAINEGATAGCYTGFADGSFQPQSNPTRGQFAFWLTNCGVRTLKTSESVTRTPGTSIEAASVTVQGPAQAGGSGYLLVDASVSAAETGSNACAPCTFRSNIRVNGSSIVSFNMIESLPTDGWGNADQSGITAIGAGENKTVTVWVENFAGTNNMSFFVNVTVTYVPFPFPVVAEGAPAPELDPNDPAASVADAASTVG